LGIPTLNPAEKLSERDIQGIRHSDDACEAHVLLAALKVPHIGPVNTTNMGELFLGPSPLAPQFTDALPETL
jgi:hypothetical protein